MSKEDMQVGMVHAEIPAGYGQSVVTTLNVLVYPAP